MGRHFEFPYLGTLISIVWSALRNQNFLIVIETPEIRRELEVEIWHPRLSYFPLGDKVQGSPSPDVHPRQALQALEIPSGPRGDILQ